jgi:hypothetical protein
MLILCLSHESHQAPQAVMKSAALGDNPHWYTVYSGADGLSLNEPGSVRLYSLSKFVSGTRPCTIVRHDEVQQRRQADLALRCDKELFEVVLTCKQGIDDHQAMMWY